MLTSGSAVPRLEVNISDCEEPQPQGQKKYQPRTPAMALGLTDCIWSVRDVLLTPVFSAGGRRQSHVTTRQRISDGIKSLAAISPGHK